MFTDRQYAALNTYLAVDVTPSAASGNGAWPIKFGEKESRDGLVCLPYLTSIRTFRRVSASLPELLGVRLTNCIVVVLTRQRNGHRMVVVYICVHVETADVSLLLRLAIDRPLVMVSESAAKEVLPVQIKKLMADVFCEQDLDRARLYFSRTFLADGTPEIIV